MALSRNYGENGGRFDVNGFELEEKPVITKYEPTSSFVRSAGDEKGHLIEAAWIHFEKTGKMPSKVYSPKSGGALKLFSARIAKKQAILTVEYGADTYSAE